jgi:hypothetical protein
MNNNLKNSQSKIVNKAHTLNIATDKLFLRKEHRENLGNYKLRHDRLSENTTLGSHLLRRAFGRSLLSGSGEL